MKVPLMAAAWLIPSAMPRWSSGKASVRMADELATRKAAPIPWKTRTTISHSPAAGPVIHVIGQQQREEGEEGEAQVVHADAPVDVAEAAEVDHEHARHHQEAQDHPQQVEAVAGLEGIEVDAAEDVGQGDEHDRAVDRGHQHAQGGVDEGHPLVAVARAWCLGGQLLDVHVNGDPSTRGRGTRIPSWAVGGSGTRAGERDTGWGM